MFTFVNRLRKHGALAVGLVVVVCAVVTSPVLAAPSQQDKQRVDKEVEQAEATLESATARAQQAGKSFAEANKMLPGAKERAAQAHGTVLGAQVKVDEARRVAVAAQARLAVAQKDFDEAQGKVSAARERLNAYARSSYESGYFVAPAMVLAAKGIEQIFAATEYAQAVAATRHREIQKMKVALNHSAQQRADVAERRRKAQEANDRAQSSLKKVTDYAAAAKSAEQNVIALTNQRAQALAVADQERAASEKLYQDLQAESARIEAALQEAARQARERAKQPGRVKDDWPSILAPGKGKGRGKGGFIMPVRGRKTSDFGWRFDPYYHRSQLHAGTDYAAPKGTPIWAVNAGRVIRSGWAGGYGNYTCIYHGDIAGGAGLSTCYGHQSKINVRAGQQVKQGQVIGLVGTTGASTGNHLHFEVRLDGRPVNPLSGWL